ncbi:MAG TPA: chromosome segregation protein SMC [Mogibacterium sp.]|nr:chromosome segregation protein SMC [Mogibacterium sp.]
MYFKRIELQGFKSFADPVSIELNDGVTCIIGPNGSGKSNISDALRWVLGEQSSKQLRGNKMQDVIFAGTATRKPRGMAEVSLVIDNSTGILPLEYTEVVVTRRMYRSGESEYLINGNQCRLRDVRELFMDTGIGVEGYSIIGQGKIADIVSIKPENRRRIFEEAAGIVLYKSRKADAETKLKSATDNIERVRDIIAEIESRIDGLKDASEKAREFIELRDKYKVLGINIILHTLGSLTKSINEGTEELEEIQSRLIDAEVRSRLLNENIEIQRENDSEYSIEYDEANHLLISKIDELNTILSGGKINEEKLNNISKDIFRLSEEIEEAEIKLEGEKKTYEGLVANENKLSRETESLRLSHSDAVIKFNDHNQKSISLNMEIESHKSNMIDINNKNVSRKAEISTLQNYKKTLSDREETIICSLSGQNNKDNNKRKEYDQLQSTYAKKESYYNEVKENIQSISDKIISVNQTVAVINSQINELSIKINTASSRMNTIQEMENNYEGYNNAVRLLMKRSINGVIGTVSDLISVPDGFESAIETALGASLQNVVCKDDSVAKNAINWLKSSGAGRITFLPVESITSDLIPLDHGVINSAGYIGIASEIVSCESKYQEIINSLLCRVIVADNMDNAIRISKKNIRGFKIVTIEGEIISSSGAITGGRYANKSANLLDRKKEISELGFKIEKYKSEIEELISKKNSAENQVSDLESQKNAETEKTHELEIEINVLKSDIEYLNKIIQSDEEAKKRFEGELSILREDYNRAEAMIAEYESQISESETVYEKYEQEIEQMLIEAENLKTVIRDDNEIIVSLKVKLSEQETRILSQNELIERVRDSITDISSEIEENKIFIQNLENSRNLLTASGEATDEKEEQLQNEKKEIEARISELLSLMEENRKENTSALNKQKETLEEIERIRDEKYKLEMKTTRNETLIEAQKEKLWDEFEVSYAEALDMKNPDFAITSGNKEMREVKLRMAELGDVNISSIEEYKSVSKRYEFMTAQEADLTKSMDELQEIIRNMDKTIRTRFKENFDQVVVNFEEAFKELFGGGYAELRLEDESQPLESGIEITAQPPGKKLKNINLLSGGEKTLTAIALMFAVLRTKPTPFVILDEVEAALDEVNIQRFSDYLRKFDDIQFALITHQKATMERADVLYGVTMPEQGISKMLSLKLGDDFDPEGLT